MSAATTPPASPRPTGRLGQGELRRMVAAHLDANPGSHTPGHIASALGRSAGAVGNALDALVERGQAERVGLAPRRYRATATTVDATRPTPTHRTPRARARAAATSEKTAMPAPRPAPPTATSSPSGSGLGPGGVRRPNGQTYHPRLLAELPDVAALRKLRAAQIPVLLYGPPGTGKTSLVEAAFPDLITVAGDGDTAVADFIGEYTQTPDGTFEFIYGPLVTAMTEGRALLIDDATLISPKVLAVVYPAMDGRRQITVKAHKGETITAADGFYVIAGHNPGVHGAVLTEALASRFAAQIRVSTFTGLRMRVVSWILGGVEGPCGWGVLICDPVGEVFAAVARICRNQAYLGTLVHPPDLELGLGPLGGPAGCVEGHQEDVDESADWKTEVNSDADCSRVGGPYDGSDELLPELQLWS